MKAVTIRNGAGTLLAFGPDNGMYDPRVPFGSTKQVEPDYEAVKAEWFSTQPKQPSIVDKRAEILSNPLVPQWFKDYVT